MKDQLKKLLDAAKKGDVAEVRRLLDEGTDPYATMKDGWTALMFAAQNGYVEIVRVLVVACETPEPRNMKTDKGRTALMFAAENGHDKVVRALLLADANPNLLDNNGNTALMFAAWNNHTKVVNILLLEGANPDVENLQGKTAGIPPK